MAIPSIINTCLLVKEPKHAFQLTSYRVNIKTSDDKIYQIKARKKTLPLVPRCIKNRYWTKVQYKDQSFYINRTSCKKQTNLPRHYLKSHLKKNIQLDPFFFSLHKIDMISKILAGEEKTDYPWTKSIQLVNEVENKRQAWCELSAKNGTHITKLDQRYIISYKNPDTKHTEFYFTLTKKLGSGGFKTVYPVSCYETGISRYALSVEKIEGDSKASSKTGFEFLQACQNSKYVIKAPLYFESKISSKGSLFAFTVTDRCEGTFDDLMNLPGVDVKTKLFYFMQLLQGVIHIHKNEIVHRDLKSKNILYIGQKIKIIDMDLSCKFGDQAKLKHRDGTKEYMAPEVILQNGIDFPEKIDSWSLGMILYRILENRPLFLKELRKTSGKDKEAKVIIEGVENLPFVNLKPKDPLIYLIKQLLYIDPADRITAQEALNQLKVIYADYIQN